MRRLAILALVVSAPAAAQPSRYPKPPVDEERANEQRSGLWEAATHPAKAPYVADIDEARRKLAGRDFAGAAKLAEHAIALLPAAPEAYDVRGQARYESHDWAGCADDLAAALARSHDGKGVSERIHQSLGECQAHAGRLADAEVTLSDLAAAPPARDAWVIWMRLGEVRVAMGKLDEAIAAFASAIGPDGNLTVPALWRRAGAYDRARQPSKAEDDVRAAMLVDRSKSQLDGGSLPLLGIGESEFLFGVAWQYAEQPSVESALLYFRRFLAIAPNSPWRRRAEEHLRELSAIPLPETVQRTSGNAPLDLDAAAKVVRAAMPHLRACLAKLPATMFEIRITRAGPRAPMTEHVRYRATPAGVQLTPSLDLDPHPAEVDAAERCLEPIADKLALPPIKDKETYYQVMFSVVAP